MLGDASHGTAEFYRSRAGITRHMIERHGVTFVAFGARHSEMGKSMGEHNLSQLAREEWRIRWP
ncbi:hypothetical protein [Falsirhodobacter sp. 1013]|uniref:hypothetical protein n=1 Tax=Falsirhodobacter sp. 1013 TaxID=3417566 RepID=UPI003EC05111